MKATHDLANLARDSLVRATSENGPDNVKPPTEISVFKCGCFFFSCNSWLKLPRKRPDPGLSPG